MKKITIILVVLLILMNVFGFTIAFAETDVAYEIVSKTVKQAYGVNLENYKAEQLDNGTIYCTFKGGYAILEEVDNDYVVQKVWYDTEQYFTNYWGAGELTEQVSAVTYVNKSENNKSLALRNPNYYIAGTTCVPNAAICIVGFYDRYYDELIPNFVAGRPVLNNYMYSVEDSNVSNAAIQLAYDMGVNNPKTDGVTVNKFKSGLKLYCDRLGRSISLTSCMSWGNFNYNNAVSHLNTNTPLIIFTNKFGVSVISNSNNMDTITTYSTNSLHAMAVFGYLEITYTLSNGNTKTDKYLRVATGMANMASGLVNVESNLEIDDAYAITIN